MLCQSKGNLDSSFELTYRTKRQLTFIGFALRRFADGLDYMIILPSLWFYLTSFGSWYFLLGLVIAADSLVAFFLSPLIERLSEKWRKIRFLGFIANLFHIGGSMIYALPLYFYMPFVGRLVSGVGVSFGSAVYAEVKRVTSPEERNRNLIIMEGVRLVGIVIGPGMNFFLKSFDLRFGPWKIDEHTAPGFFMALVWFVVQVVHIFTVYDLDQDPQEYQHLHYDDDPTYNAEHKTPPPEDETVLTEENTEHKTPLTEDEATLKKDLEEDDSSFDEHDPTSDDGEPEHDEITTYDDNNSNIEKMPLHNGLVMDDVNPLEVPPGNVTKPSLLSMLGRRDVMLILTTQFFMFFNQTAFETLILLIGIEKLNFNINILSGVLIMAGVEMVIVIVAVWSASKTLDAKYLLLTAISCGILASFARLAVSFTKPHSAGCLAMTLLMGCFTIIGTPITSISGKSLLPKITRPENHGFYQSAFATSQHLGLVTGPLVASAMYNYMVLFSSLIVVVFLVIYLLAMKVVEKIVIPAHGCGKLND